MRRSAVLIAAALLSPAALGLAGCGSTPGASTARPPVSKLCVDVSVPLSGPHATVGRALLAGIRMEIPVGGLALNAYRVRLCEIRDDAASRRRSSAEMALDNATKAAGSLNTIAEIGELSSGDAQTAEAVLAPAGIPLLTPSGPVAPASTPPVGTAPPLRNTALYLLPSAATEADAVSRVSAWHDCAERRHGVNQCIVLGPDRAPLCTGIAPASVARARTPHVRSSDPRGKPGRISDATVSVPRYCVLGGPDLAGWSSPAQAYGDGAAKLLVSDLKRLAAGGRAIADRGTVLGALRHGELSAGQSPIGPVRFDSAGAIEADGFSAYSVAADGGLHLSRSFRTH